MFGTNSAGFFVRNNSISRNKKPRRIYSKNKSKLQELNIMKGTGGRLGDHIILFVSKISLHYKYNHSIHSINPQNAKNSIFIKLLRKSLYEYYKGDKKVEPNIVRLFSNTRYTLQSIVPFCVVDLQKDIRTAFRETPVYQPYRNSIISNKQKLPIDPKKTIAVHIRLGDIISRSSRTILQPNGFNNVVKKLNNNDCKNLKADEKNSQCPIRENIISKIIDIAKKDFPEHEVVIFCEPGSKCNLPYRCIQSHNPDDDLVCLMLSDVLIGAHSNFSLSAFLFHEGSKAYLPMWGHHAFIGLGTKFDHTDVCFFNGYNGNII